jgi:hypothetical protein
LARRPAERVIGNKRQEASVYFIIMRLEKLSFHADILFLVLFFKKFETLSFNQLSKILKCLERSRFGVRWGLVAMIFSFVASAAE